MGSGNGSRAQAPAEGGVEARRQYALHQEQHAVAANFGVQSKGWMFWTAILVLVLLVFFAVLGMAL